MPRDYSPSHDDLVARGHAWLKKMGCSIVLHELVTNVSGGEIPDVIGWRQGISILIECKVSRNDFSADRHKWFRKFPDRGMGDWRFYLCPVGLVVKDEVPPGWGLLEATRGRIWMAHGGPENRYGLQWGRPQFQAHKRNETIMLVSALRRLELRGHLDLIYQGLSEKTETSTGQPGDCRPPSFSALDSPEAQSSLMPPSVESPTESTLAIPPISS